MVRIATTSVACLMLFAVCCPAAGPIAQGPTTPATKSGHVDVEKALLAIDLRSQLRAYERVVDALHGVEFELAMFHIEQPSAATKERRNKLQLKLKLLENLKETAVLRAKEINRQLSGADSETD